MSLLIEKFTLPEFIPRAAFFVLVQRRLHLLHVLIGKCVTGIFLFASIHHKANNRAAALIKDDPDIVPEFGKRVCNALQLCLPKMSLNRGQRRGKPILSRNQIEQAQRTPDDDRRGVLYRRQSVAARLRRCRVYVVGL